MRDGGLSPSLMKGKTMRTTRSALGRSAIAIGTLFAALFLAVFSAGSASATTAPAATAAQIAPAGDVSAQAYVGVPGNYVYNPDLGSLHDYCTWSPDAWFSADFRGPCARHDLCYQEHTAGKAACDSRFHSDLDSNCNYFYPEGSTSCLAASDTYYAAVVQFGGYSVDAAGKVVPERVGAAGTTRAPDLR